LIKIGHKFIRPQRAEMKNLSQRANVRDGRRLMPISIQSRRIAMRSKHFCTVARIAAGCVMAMLAGQSAQAQTYKVLHTFNGIDGANPAAELIRDADGNLYGTSQDGGTAGTLFELSKTDKLTTLYTFKGGADGAGPRAGVIQGAHGNLYGATTWGGNGACESAGCGTVFKLSKTGKEAVLYRFTGWPDGAYPNGVIQDAKSNFYGTTLNGGSGHNGNCSLNGAPYGCGTVFKVDASGKETVLHNFTDNADGGYPEAGLIQDAEGNLYGTAGGGGGVGCYHGCGIVFMLDRASKETVLYRFKGGNDGASPYAGVIRDKQGNLYGTTSAGGGHGQGTVFRLSKTGKETVLYSFCSKSGCADGAFPWGVIQDAKGNLYGTTLGGGGSSDCIGGDCGTVFKLDTKGKEVVLHNFTGGADGGNPYAGVIWDGQGNLYGTTYWGGNLNCDDSGFGCGVVFELTP
jgi:uncharacterized repeat protein (TIGR03803 family)